jgi:Ca-activated chloride channel homolog
MFARRIYSGAVALWLFNALMAGAAAATATAADEKKAIPGGELQIIGADGQPAGACPLKHTDVRGDIAGFVGRVTVKQTFHNPTNQKIEAVYVFPLPQNAAVDDMVMTVGDRRIAGQIKEREEAREIYEAAKAAGHVASLLDQERPNIFTQSVANIEPGVEVIIEISYVETLKYEDGVFEWVFPMVVGPRYIPGGGSAPAPMTTGQDTPQVPDASKITPPVTPKGTRAGHDISLTVTVDGGMQIMDIQSKLHEVNLEPLYRHRETPVRVTLKNQTEIPNKDFILRYRLATDDIADAFLVHSDGRGTFFTLILQPPQRIVPAKLMPRELIFVLDSSGSMSGFPIETAKVVMAKAIDQLRPGDTFNLITFAGDTRIMWPEPRPATKDTIAEAQKFLSERQGGGGTEMMKAIDAALVQTAPANSDPGAGGMRPIRVVCFMTDGYVGNDMAIIDAVKKNAGTTRVFSFGIGNSVNRFLLDGMARAGRGEVEYVTLQGQAEAAAERFHERILAPVLTDIAIDWGTVPVADVYPQQVPDLFSAKPIMVHGRLAGPVDGTIAISGNTGAGPQKWQLQVSAPGNAADHEALASLWARAKGEDLMSQDYAAAQTGQFPDELKKQVIGLGIEFRLMTQFTSFVAVEEMTVTVDGQPVRVDVPVEMPDGVSYEGVFGKEMRAAGGPARGAVAGGALMPAAQAARPAADKKEKPRTEAARQMVNGADEAEDYASTQPALTPEQIAQRKLAEPLRDLAAMVAKEGKDGNYTDGKLKVANYRLSVMIYLRDLSDETLAALKKLGFEQTGDSKTVKLLIGSVDVRKLEELSKLDVVIRVQPIGGK